VILPRIGSGLRRTGRILIARPRATLWTLVALTCALFAAGIAALAADQVDRWHAAPGSGGSMVVYLGEGVDDAHAQTLVTQLAQVAGVEHAELVPAAESAKRLQAALGADSALLDGVELGSLPPSVEVTLQPGMRDVIALSPTVAALKGTPGVDDVIVEDGGKDRAAASMTVVRTIAWTAAALLSALALIIVLAATRVRMEKNAREQAVLSLLGASPWFMGMPTALAGALQGALAAGLAAIAVCVALGVVALPVAVTAPAAAQILCFIALGAALGLAGGGLAGAARATR